MPLLAQSSKWDQPALTGRSSCLLPYFVLYGERRSISETKVRRLLPNVKPNRDHARLKKSGPAPAVGKAVAVIRPSSHPPLWPPSVRRRASTAGAISPPGSVSFRGSSPPEASRSCSESANALASEPPRAFVQSGSHGGVWVKRIGFSGASVKLQQLFRIQGLSPLP